MSQSNPKPPNNVPDPNGVGQKGDFLFGLPYTVEESELVILPVPWDLTVSYGDGTRKGPQAVLDASSQLDLEDPVVSEAWTLPRQLLPLDLRWQQRSKSERRWVESYLRWLENGQNPEQASEMAAGLQTANEKCGYLLDWVRTQARHYRNLGKTVAILGGDHSTPLGLMEVLGQDLDSFGILHIDAHMDLRNAYEGFDYSHASIMFNALRIPSLSRLVQVGIRDYCPAEKECAEQDERVTVWTDHALASAMHRGTHWHDLCLEIVKALPEQVYISFDIDGLRPCYAPGTGTPVPGGLEYNQALHLLEVLYQSGRRIVGFDLVEVAPSKGDREWNGNVGARLLYRLSNLCLASNGSALTRNKGRQAAPKTKNSNRKPKI